MSANFRPNSWLAFALAWLLTFVLYFPAQRAGFVGDFYKDWLNVIQEESFSDYVNRPGTSTLYQFTQILTFLIYKVIGAPRTGWHLVHVTMHAVTAAFLFQFIRNLLADSGIAFAHAIASCVSILFVITPYSSEVVVHEPCLHYTFGFCLLLLPLIWLQRFMTTGEKRYLLWVALQYLPASFSLEIFYLTPMLVVWLWYYYQYILGNKRRFADLFRWCLLPMTGTFLLHILLVRLMTHNALPHQVPTSIGGLAIAYGDKVLRYLFHIIFLGRFFPAEQKQVAYNALTNSVVVIAFHAILAASIFLILRSKKAASRWKLISFLAPVTLLLLAIVTPRQFPDMGLVVFDRYVYFALPFVYLILALAPGTSKFRYPAVLIFLAFATVNVVLLRKVNYRWKASNEVVERLLESFPLNDQKTTLLLNLPEHYEGILMTGSNRPSAFKTAYNAKHDLKITGDVHDLASFNMTSMNDGAHVRVLNDSMLHITLNQWGTWWWFHYLGASSFENEVYRLDMKDPGHWYELTLKKPAAQYQLLFLNGGQWRPVDMNKKEVDQY